MKMRERFFIFMVFATLCSVEAYAATAANGLATTGYVDGAVADKADKATTLAGYGIGNAYTKTETDTAITNKINALDATNTVTAGNYITGVNETNGVVSVSQAAMDTTPTANSTKPVTSGGVKSALDGKLSTTGTAAKATADAAGNNIADTYATKDEMETGLAGKQATLGYTAEDSANKTTSIAAAATANDTKYPTEKAVRTALDTKADKTAIPTVNNATLTIQKNGTTLKTFTANQATNETVNVTVPTKVSELTNDSSYATTGAVAAKQDISNIVTDGDDAQAYETSTTKYPSMAVMNTSIASAVDGINDELGALAFEDSINTDFIDNNAVTTVKIKDLNVTTGKLAADAVTNAKLADDAVQTENIKKGAVTAEKTTGIFGYIPSGSATATATAQIWVQ